MRTLHKEEMAVVAGGIGAVSFTNTQDNNSQSNFQGGNSGTGIFLGIGVNNNFPAQLFVQNANVTGPEVIESSNNTSISL
jgi:hypothetical protein